MSESNSPTSADIVIGRSGDPLSVIVDKSLAAFIVEKKKSRDMKHETFKTGGLIFYNHEGEMLFSLPTKEVMELVPQEIWKHFNFPISKLHPRGLVNSQHPPRGNTVRVALPTAMAA